MYEKLLEKEGKSHLLSENIKIIVVVQNVGIKYCILLLSKKVALFCH